MTCGLIFKGSKASVLPTKKRKKLIAPHPTCLRINNMLSAVRMLENLVKPFRWTTDFRWTKYNLWNSPR